MPRSLLAEWVAKVYGEGKSLTEELLATSFGDGNLSWVYAHPPSRDTLLELLSEQPQPPPRHLTH